MTGLNRAMVATGLCVGLSIGGAYAQGVQRISNEATPVQAAATPIFSQQPAPKASTAQQGQNRAGSPMPTPMPAAPPRADLVGETLNMVAPLTSEEIIKLRREVAARAQAVTQAIVPAAKPINRVTRLDFGPGAAPEIIRVTTTEGATISFMDSAGRPWKMVSADNFHPTGLDIGRSGEHGLVVSAKVPETTGNVSVRLENLSSPISLKIIASSSLREVDYSVDLQVPRFIPGLPVPVGDVNSQPGLGADELMNYLLKTPPKDARALSVDGLPGALAWQAPSGRIILRTNQMVISPNWARRQSSSDGMTVYELPITPLVLVSDEGRLSNVRINGAQLSVK